VDARSILGVSAMRASFLDHVSAAEATRAAANARESDLRLTQSDSMASYRLDDDDDLEDDDSFYEEDDADDEDDAEDEDEDDEEDDDDIEPWQVSHVIRRP
jgi:hypothetical protein